MRENQIFAIFLKNLGIKSPQFRKTDYGYRTIDGVYCFFKDKMEIIKVKSINTFNGYEYKRCLEETKYYIRQETGVIRITPVQTKIFK